MADLRVKAYGTAAAILALDRLTKWWIERHVTFLDSYRIIPGFFDIIHSENRGVAFGLFNNSTSQWRTTLLILGALVLGGAAGNLLDRILWGRVTDCLLFYAGQYQWPAFNLAHSAVVIGSGLLVIDLIRPKRRTANVSCTLSSLVPAH